jgi:uncharacterized protein YjcR
MIALPHSIREEARCAYLTGVRITQIAEDLGVKRVTVSQWAKRGGWARERTAAVEQRMESILHTVEDVTIRHILQHKEQVQRLAEAQIESLAEFQPKKAREFLAAAKALDKIDSVVRRNLGIPCGQARGGISLG